MCVHLKRFRYAIAILTLALFVAAHVASGAGPDPQAIEELQGGKRAVAQASWWGFQPEESTAALQAAIDSGAKRVVVEKMPSPWIVDQLRLASDQELFFEPGTEVLAKKGAFHGSADSLFSAAGKKNIKLIGPGATLRMRRADYDGPDYKHAEWRHVLKFHGCTGITVEGLTLAESGGDGIYLGAGPGGAPCCLSGHSALFCASCRRHSRPDLPISSQTVDLLVAGTMIGSWLPQPALKTVMTTGFGDLSGPHRTSAALSNTAL